MARTKSAGKSARLTNSVLRAGYGRGFVVECRHVVQLGVVDRLVITAAHVLTKPADDRYASTTRRPCLPAADPTRSAAEATYARFLGPLNGKCTVAAECVFVDPIADIAVFGAPDILELDKLTEAYHALVNGMTPLRIADPPAIKTEVVHKAKLAVENGVARPPNETYAVERRSPGIATVQVLSLNGKQWIRAQAERRAFLKVPNCFEDGMSGSPILDFAGNAIGVVSTTRHNAILTEHLGAGLVRRIRDCQ